MIPRDITLKKAQTDEEKILLSNIYDKYIKSEQKGYNTYSKFLNLKEQELLSGCFEFIKYNGGYDEAERKISAFLVNDYGNYPIKSLVVLGKDLDNLSHRDVLGSLMGLGLKREAIGDILIGEEIIFFCLEEVMEYILSNLKKIGNKNIEVKENFNKEIFFDKKFEIKNITISSMRVDNLIKGVCNLSRNDAVALIGGYKVMVNQKPVIQNDFKIRIGDVISVRGYGKFQVNEELGISKKGKNRVEIKKYI